MPRKRVESEKLTGRVSENYLPLEAIEYVRSKLEQMDQAELIREAIEVLWKYETGQLFEANLEQTLTKVLQKTDINLATNDQEEIVDKSIEQEIESELESQFDEDGNLDFHF